MSEFLCQLMLHVLTHLPLGTPPATQPSLNFNFANRARQTERELLMALAEFRAAHPPLN
jgi:hypothetical protein